jgi:8-amino-7-oxononanoate synthase
VVLDLTGSLYLGLRHASGELGSWEALTTGLPAALGESDETAATAAGLAGLVGAQRAVLFRSTLHAFLDLFAGLPHAMVLLDDASYPIARHALTGGLDRRDPVRTFRHRDVADLRRQLGEVRGRRPLVVTDGYCTGCAHTAPIAEYLEALRPHRGVLVLDDTQGLGILGSDPGPATPYGHGGGGTARWADAQGCLVQVASLAKGFGAPVAVLAGSAQLIDEIRTRGPTRLHSSAPSRADVRAAEHALTVNAAHGDQIRARLLSLVRRFRQRSADRGTRLAAGEFPVQRLAPTDGRRAMAMHAWLLDAGLRTVVTQPPCHPAAAVTVVLNAALSPAEVDRAADLIAVAATRTERHPGRAGAAL